MPAFLLKYKINHLLFWTLLFAVWYYMRYEDYSTTELAIKVSLIKVIDLALMIYITNGLLIPRLLYRKRYAWFLLSFVLLVICSSVLKMNMLGRLLYNPDLYRLTGNLKGRVYDNVIPHFFLVIAGAAFKLMNDYSTLQQRMAGIAKEKAEAELNFLKSQINPHFLFNSLNAVYFLIDKSNQEARAALGKFSDMLRYQLYEMNDARIPIEKEIRYLQDYVDLQRLRKDHQCEVNFCHATEVQGFSIEPLLLIPFVENAFKHVSHFTGKVNFIQISMMRSGNEFHFTVENSREEEPVKPPQHSGIGLGNVQKRLQLLYPGNHQLDIVQEARLFKINLRLAT